MSLQVTVDKQDTVLKVERPAGESRWRFKRLRPVDENSAVRKLTIEQEQEICAAYMDQRDLSVAEIAQLFSVSSGAVQGVAEAYGLSRRGHRKFSYAHLLQKQTEQPAATQLSDQRQSKTDLQDEVDHLRLETERLTFENENLTRQIQDRDDRAEDKEHRITLILERLSGVMDGTVASLIDKQIGWSDIPFEIGKMRGLLEWAIAEVGR